MTRRLPGPVRGIVFIHGKQQQEADAGLARPGHTVLLAVGDRRPSGAQPWSAALEGQQLSLLKCNLCSLSDSAHSVEENHSVLIYANKPF